MVTASVAGSFKRVRTEGLQRLEVVTCHGSASICVRLAIQSTTAQPFVYDYPTISIS